MDSTDASSKFEHAGPSDWSQYLLASEKQDRSSSELCANMALLHSPAPGAVNTNHPDCCRNTHRTSCTIQLACILQLNIAKAQHGEAQIGDQDAGNVADAALENQLSVALQDGKRHSTRVQEQCMKFDCGQKLWHSSADMFVEAEETTPDQAN